MNALVYIIFANCLGLVFLFPAFHDGGDISSGDLAAYLTSVGYLNHVSSSLLLRRLRPGFDKTTIQHGLKDFQRTWSLPVTGLVDEATRSRLNIPRCGDSDRNIVLHTNRRRKRFELEGGGGWDKNFLTYNVTQYPANLSTQAVHDVIVRAFTYWTDEANLTVVSAGDDEADIVILFAEGSHGDDAPFDGRGGIVAHAGFPKPLRPVSGDTHFDAAEDWGIGEPTKLDLLQVSTHEFGHALGLAHTRDPTAVMFPYFKYRHNFSLAPDDIRGIRALYGDPVNGTGTVLRPRDVTDGVQDHDVTNSNHGSRLQTHVIWIMTSLTIIIAYNCACQT